GAELRRASRKPPGTPWWRAVEGARWDAPEGPGSSLEGRGDHPVVHVSLRDAEAFAAWCGMRLPREAEWEKAARGGLDQARYAWGDQLTPGGEHRCNIWQGAFPVRNTLEDGHLGTAPVRSFPPNGFGLYEVAGNVWERCSDPSTTGRADSLTEDVRVMRGGSYLCHDSSCNRYRVAARSSTATDDARGNTASPLHGRRGRERQQGLPPRDRRLTAPPDADTPTRSPDIARWRTGSGEWMGVARRWPGSGQRDAGAQAARRGLRRRGGRRRGRGG